MPKPVWPLSLKLMPHHLQFADGYRAEALARRLACLPHEDAGVLEAAFDEKALGAGNVTLRSLRARFPSGELIDGEVPAPRSFQEVFRPSTVTLDVLVALPTPERGGPQVDRADSPGRLTLRYVTANQETNDELGRAPTVNVALLRARPRILFGGESTEGLETLFIGRLVRREARVEVDARIVPRLIAAHASPFVIGGLRKIRDRMLARRRELVELRRWEPSKPERFEPNDTLGLLALLAVDRFLPRLDDVLAHDATHPHVAYREVCRFVAALGVVDEDRAPFQPVVLDLDEQGRAFAPLFDETLRLLAVELPRRFVTLSFERLDAVRHHVTIPRDAFERRLFLGVLAKVDVSGARERLPNVIKAGAPSTVESLTGSASRGLPVLLEHSPPAALPQRRGLYLYRFDTSSAFWSEVRNRGELTVFLPTSELEASFRLFVLDE